MKKNFSLLMILFTVSFSRFAPSRTPALRTENVSKIDLLKRSSPYFPGFSVQGMVLENAFCVLLKRPIFYTKIHGLKGGGS